MPRLLDDWSHLYVDELRTQSSDFRNQALAIYRSFVQELTVLQSQVALSLWLHVLHVRLHTLSWGRPRFRVQFAGRNKCRRFPFDSLSPCQLSSAAST